MFCKNCGKIIDDDSKFCKYCGANLINIKQINLINKTSSLCTKIELTNTKIINFINYLFNNDYLPFNRIKKNSLIIYTNTETLYIENKINKNLSEEMLFTLLNKENSNDVFIQYEQQIIPIIRKDYKRDYFDMRCLYGCPGSSRIQNKEKIEALNNININIDTI